MGSEDVGPYKKVVSSTLCSLITCAWRDTCDIAKRNQVSHMPLLQQRNQTHRLRLQNQNQPREGRPHIFVEAPICLSKYLERDWMNVGG